MNKITTARMEIVLAKYFNLRRNIIIPNAYFGLGFNHEIDLLILSRDLYATEVEIKVSKYDLIKDKEKWHNHSSIKIKKLYFAIPEYLLPFIEHIPENAGIVVVKKIGNTERYYCEEIRSPKANMKARPFNRDEVNKMLHLGVMRIWKLKEKLLNYGTTRKDA